jgi:hypothetical protein
VSTILLADAQPGDLVFCHSAGVVGAGIRLVERFRRAYSGAAEAPGDNWNHVAVLVSVKGRRNNPANWTVLQAEGKGVAAAALSSVAPGGNYEIVRLPVTCEASKVTKFMRAQTGSRYGFVTVASILVTLLTPRFFDVMKPGTWICSAVAAESMRYGGWLHNWGDLYTVSPAELWVALQ